MRWLLWLVVTLAATPALAQTEVPADEQVTHAIGFQATAYPNLGFFYRHYFGRNALQVNMLPNVLDGGDYVFLSTGLQWVHYALEWGRSAGNSGGLLASSTGALRLVAGGGVALTRDATKVSVPADNCQTAACQKIVNDKTPLQYLASGGLGFGVEFGARRRGGISLAIDLVMTVLYDNEGFYGAYPLPSLSAGYSW